MEYKSYKKPDTDAWAEETLQRKKGNVIDNMQYFDRWMLGKEKYFGNNSPSLYNEVFFQASEYCVTFCYKFPKEAKKTNMSVVIDATENPGEFEHKLNKCFAGIMNLRNQWIEWEKDQKVKK